MFFCRPKLAHLFNVSIQFITLMIKRTLSDVFYVPNTIQNSGEMKVNIHP